MLDRRKLTPKRTIGEVNIKDRLEAYRRRKCREKCMGSIRSTIQTMLPWNQNKTAQDNPAITPSNYMKDTQDTESTCSDDSIDGPQNTMLTKIIYLLYFLLWATLYIIAIEYEFGAVYFILTTLIFIWLNTRSRPKEPGELSAYSVFNPKCKAIEGTLDASQFEREIRYGIGSVR